MSEREPSKETIENSLAIGKLVALQERTTKDVDRLVVHIERILPLTEAIKGVSKRVEHLEKEADEGVRPVNLKWLLVGATSMACAYVGWCTLEIIELKETQTERDATQTEKHKKIDKTINDIKNEIHVNENQITYLKGRIKK